MNKRALGKVLLFGLVGTLLLTWGSYATEKYDIIIKGGKIVDGMGRPGVIGDVAIRGDKIVAVGNVVGEAAKVIDATGLIVCPGFIDTHSHADGNILRYPLAENYIMQGVTMLLVGQCGGSAAPSREMSFGDWMTKVEKTPISINMAVLAGLTSTIRNLVLGDDFKRDATKEEVEREKAYMEEAMRAGAFGLSTAMTSGPREYTSDEELVETAKVAQKYGGIWSAHTRWQEHDWVKEDRMEMGYGLTYDPPGEVFSGRYHGLLEAIDLSRRANNILQLIAHFNTGYLIPQPHPTYLDEASAMATLDEIINPALAAGQPVYYNIIAPDNSGTGRETQLIEWFFNTRLATPDWLKKMKREEFVENLKTAEFREKIKRIILYSGRFKFKYVHPMQDPYWMDCFRILTHKNPAYVSRTVGEMARERSPQNIKKAVYDESVKLVFDMIVEDPTATWADVLDKREDTGSHRVFLKHPSGMPCSDTSCCPAVLEPGKPKPGPGAYGFMPHYIDTQVKKYRAMTVEEAVMKATYVPAQKVLGLKDRGVLSPNAYADIVVFNLDTIRWSGDFLKPNIPPEGIEYVLVNGKIAYKDKAHTGEKSGKLLRHQF